MAYPFLSDLIYDLTGIKLWLPLPTFGLMLATSILVAVWVTTINLKDWYQRKLIGDATVKVKKNEKITYEKVAPHTLISEMAMICALAGIIGARIFHILEYPDQFMRDPVGMLFARGGLTIYGGLIFGTGAGVWFVRKHKLNVLPMADAIAPSLMLAYAVGRIGCQISGDGDWGIRADMSLKPEWVPDWLWASQYIGNVIGEHIPPPGVYPTPLYETIVCFLMFLVLWWWRRHPFQYGWLFSLYLVLAGIERFFIEKIRVNARYHFGGIEATQAEIISIIIIILGICGLAYFSKRRTELKNSES